METIRWSVAQVLSQNAISIQKEVSRSGAHTYMPMMRFKRFIDGKESNTARPAMPGYMFVWGAAGNFYGRDGKAIIARIIGDISEAQYQAIKDDNTAGRHDEIAAGPESALREQVKRRRRSRPSKRARMRAAARRALAREGEAA